MRVNERMKKILSIALTLCMILSYIPAPAYAVGTDCTHHTEHTAECGYVEAVAGVPCAHVHDENCGYVEAVAEVLCACEATDENGAIVHTEGCGYVAPVTGAECTHVHDDACGYVAAVEGHECHYECAECAAAAASEEAPEESSEPAPVCTCAEACTTENFNEYCDVCGVDYSKCTGTDTAVQYDGGAIDLSTLTETYLISDSGEYTFTGTGSYGIKVESGNPTIVLDNANITVGEGSAIDVASSSNATIFVLGDNTIGTTKTEYSDVPCGGIFVAEGGTVNITSNGTDNILRARGTLAAAIGGKYILYSESYNAGNISISNVTVYAYTNDNYAAAIGAAGRGSCGTINITNAAVYAYGAGDEYTSAPGIGSAWNHVGWSETIPVVIISDSEIHTFRYNPYSDYIGYLGDESGEEGGFHATGSINCGEGGSVKSSTIYCYTGLDATTTDKVVKYGALGGLLKEDGTCEGEHSGGTQTCMGYKCANCGNWFGEKNDTHDWSNKDGICANGCELTCDHESYTEGVCDVCDYACTHTTEKDENKATCKHGDICDLCGTEYGNQDADNHTGTLGTPVPAEDGKHTATWSCCEATVTEEHTFENGKCTVCGAACTHSSFADGKCTACGIPVCTCTVKCGETVDTTCAVCYAEGADLSAVCNGAEEPPVVATNNIDAAEMTPEDLKAAVDAALAARYTAITVNLAEDAGEDMFSAITAALATTVDPSLDQYELVMNYSGTIDLTISGAKTVPECTFYVDEYVNENWRAGAALRSVTLTDAITIGESAFFSCAMTCFSAPNVIEIEGFALEGCMKLTDVYLPSVQTLGDAVFSDCYALKTISVPECIDLGNGVFNSCEALETVYAPKATNLGAIEFMMCTSLMKVTLGSVVSVNQRYESIDNGLFCLANDTKNIELILACDQKALSFDSGTKYWAATEEAFAGDNQFIGYTFKSITLAHTPVADDGDCTTAVKCATCGETVVEAKESHTTELAENKATCQNKAKCDLCGTEYGEKDTNNHTGTLGTPVPTEDDTQHIATWSCCEATVTEEHTFENGKCVCGTYIITIGNVTAKNFDGTDRVWKSGDTIKVDVWDKDNGGHEHTELTYDGTSWGSIITDTQNPVVFAVIGNGMNLDVNANKNSYFISVSDQQEQSPNVDDYDLMYAYKASINTDAQLDLHFEHLFTKITVNIEYGSEFTETPKVEYVLFISEPLKPVVTITGINDGNLHFEYAEDWIHPSQFINYGDEADMTDDTVEVIVGIGTLPAGYDFIHFYDRFGSTEPWKKVLVPEGGLTFVAGEAYEYNVLITSDGAKLLCAGEHSFTYTPNEDGTSHKKVCSDCGYAVTEEHTLLTYSASGNVITVSCSVCHGTVGTATITAGNTTYNGTAQETATVAYSAGWKGGELTVSYANNTNAGTATASITIGEATASVEFTIAKAEINIDDLVNPEFAANLVYDGTKKALVTAHGSVPGGTILYSLTYDGEYTSTIPVATEAGRYGVYWLIQGDENHEDILSPGWTQVIIAAKPGTDANVTLGEYDSVYSGTAKEPGIASVVVDGVTLTAGKDYDVSYENNVYAGTAKAVITFKGNYSGTVTETFQISKAPLTVTADDKSMTTGRDLPAFTYTITGFVNGETEAVLTTKPTVSCEADGQTAGTYDITVSGAEAANYDITHVNGTLSVVDHQHAWTYTADGDTITAKCGNADTCPDAEQTIKIAAEGKTYDGTPVTATLTGNIDGVDTPAIRYFKNGTELNESVINAGTYTASITLGEATASVEFTIAKAEIDGSTLINPEFAKGLVYNGTAQALVTKIGSVDGGYIVYSLSIDGEYTTTIPVATEAGTYRVYWTIECDENHYVDGTPGSSRVTIAKANPEYTVPTGLTATYGDTLAKVELPTGWAWKDAETTFVGNAGTRTFKALYNPDSNNYNTVEADVTVEVAKADPEYTVPTGLTATYGDTLADVELPTGWAWNDAESTSVGNAGTSTFKALYNPDNNNYNTVEADVTIEVAKALIDIYTANLINPEFAEGLIYNGTARALVTNSGSIDGGYIVFSLNPDGEYTTEIPVATEAGEYVVYYRIEGDENHYWEGSSAFEAVTIAKANPEYTVPTGLTATYGDTLANVELPTGWAWKDAETTFVGNAGTRTFKAVFTPANTVNYNTVEADVTVEVAKANPEYTVPTGLTATYGDTLANVELPTGWAWKDAETTSVGNAGTRTFKAVFTPADTVNYNTVEADVTIEVAKAEIDGSTLINPEFAEGLIYNGTAQALVTKIGSVDGGYIVYSLSIDGEYTTTIPVATEAGTYRVYWTIECDENHYVDGTPGSSRVTIAAKDASNATVTLDDTSVQFDGTAKTPGVTSVIVDGKTLNAETDYEVSYSNNIYVGTATVTITFKGNYTGNAIATFTIVRAAAPAIQWPTAGSLTYSQKLSESTLTSEDANGTFAWENGEQIPTVTNSGYVVVYTPKDTVNYDYSGVTLAQTIPVTVSKAPASVETAPAANTLIYTGEAQALVTAGAANNGEMQYSTDNQTWSTAIPKGTNAGEYTVYYKVVGDANHIDTDVQSVVVKIGQLAVAEPTVSGTYTYTGEEQTAQLTGVESYMTVASGNKATNAGSYEVVITLDGNHKWADGSDGKVQWSIGKAQAEIAVNTDPITAVYGGTVKLPEATANFGAVTCDTTADKLVNAGTYTVTYTVAGTDNYDGDTKTVTVKINPKAITEDDVQLNGSLVYTGSEQTQQITVTAGIDFEVTGNKATNVGSYTLTVTASGNYTGSVTKDWSIKAAAVIVETAPKANNLTYTGEAQELVTAGTAKGGKLVYSLSENGEFTEAIPAGTNAGEYTVWYYVVGDDNHSDSAKASVKVTIAKAQAVIAVDTTTISVTYGEQVTLPTATTNFGTVVCDKTAADLVNAGTYTVTYTVEGTANYEGDTKTLTVIVEKKAVAEPTVSGTYTYTGSEQTVALSGDESYMTVASGNKGTNAGNYEVVITLDGNHKWADGSDGKIQWSIGKAKATITVDTTPITVTYGETVTLPTATANFGTVVCDKTAADLVNAETYTVTYTVAGTANYEGDTNSLTVIVAQKAVAEPTVTSTYTYTGEEQTVALSGDESYMTVASGNKGINAGNYEVIITLDGNHKWADGSDGKIQWSIGKAQAEIAVNTDPITVTYGETVKLPTATSNFGTVSCDKTANDLVNAGTYTVTYTVAGTDNYNGDTKTVTVTVNPKAITEADVSLNGSLVYTGSELTQAVTVTAGVTYEVTGNKATDVGTYELTVKATGNYTGEVSLTWSIKAAAATVVTAPKANTLTYTGKAQALVTAGTAKGGKLVYSLTEDGEYTETIPAGTNVGEYTVWYYVNGDYNHSDSAKASVKVTIAKAKAEISVDTTPITVTYGETVELPNATSSFGTVSCDKTADELVNAGTYTVTYTVEGTDNYEGDTKTVTVTINAKPITSADVELNGALTYTGTEQTQAVTVKDGITYTVSGDKATDAGSYELTVSGTGNYTGDVKLSYAVARKSVTVVWENTELVYNGSDQKPTAKLAGIVTGDDVKITVSGSGKDAKSYTAMIEISGADVGNYALSSNTKAFTIAPAPVTFTVSNNAVEEGKEIAVAVTADTENVEYTVTYRQNGSTVTPSAVGAYDIFVAITDTNYRHATSANGDAIKVGVLTIYEGTKPASYTLSYTPGEGSGTMAAEAEALPGTVRILPESTFTAPKDSNDNDMLFAGWTDGEATYKAGEKYIQPNKNVVLTAVWVAEEHNISGMVMQFVSLDSDELVKRGGVVITLMLGSKQVAQAVTDENGNYSFEHCLLGTYNLIAEYEGIKQTVKAVLGHTDMTDLEIDLPAGKTNTTVEVAPGTPDVVVGGLDEMMKETDETVFTEEDKQFVEAGGKVEIKMEVKENPAPTNQTELEAKAEEVSDTTQIGLYLDLDLTKTVTKTDGTETSDPITVANKLLENIIFLPGYMQGKNTYHVFREHDGVIEELPELSSVPTGTNEGFIVDRVNHTITIYAMKYSTYGIGFSEECGHQYNTNTKYTDNGDGTHSLICDQCNNAMESGKHSDIESDQDHKCDYCGAAMPKDGTKVEIPTDDTGTIIPGAPAEIDGKPIVIDWDGEIWLEDKNSKILVTYKFNEDEDPHKEYPTAMYAWYLKWTGDTCEAIRVPELDNFMTYKGTSIRVGHSSDGIRFFTAVPVDALNKVMAGTLLTGELEGYKLVEMGTLYKWAATGTELTIENGAKSYVYGGSAGSTYRQFSKEGNLSWFTGMLTDLPGDAQTLAKDILSRPYAVFQKGNDTIVLYGGSIQRSIYYVALQNKDTWATGTAYDNYVEKIISTVDAANG